MAANDVKAGGAFVEVFVKGLQSVQAQLGSFGQGMTKLGAGIAAAGGAIVGPMAAAVAHFTAVGSALADMSARTGIAASSLAELKYAAEQTGSSAEDVENSVRKMQRTIVDAGQGTSTAVEALATLGLAAADLEGKLPEQQLEVIGQRLAAIADPTLRAATAMEIFGRSGTKLLPMLADLARLRQEARDQGLIPTDESVAAADALGDAFDKVKSTILASAFEIGAALAPMLMPALEIASQAAVAVNQWVRQNGTLVRTIALVGAALVVVGTAVATLGGTLVAAGAAIGTIGVALPTLIAIGPAIGVAVVAALALAAAIALVVLNWNRIVAAGSIIISTFRQLWEATRNWHAALRLLIPAMGPLERLATFLQGVAVAAGVATATLTAQASAITNLAAGWDDYADSINEANAALDVSLQMSRTIEAAEKRRARLVDEFATAEERAAAKEREIFAAIAEVNRNRVLSFISPEQAAAETRALNIALHRHRLAEAERRRRAADRGRKPEELKLPAVPELGALGLKPEHPSTTAGSAAAALALTFGGVGRGDVSRDLLAELRAIRREDIKRHVEIVRELRAAAPRIGP